jgi:phage-related tail fiber protein
MPIERLSGITGYVAAKPPVRVATTGAILLSGLQTIDGVLLTSGERVLVKDQVNTIQNGIYIVSDGAWSRAYDFNGPRDVVRGSLIYVNDGTVNTDTVWRVASPTDPVTPGVSAIGFTQVQISNVAPPDFSDIYWMYGEIVRMYNEIIALRDECKFWASQALNAASGVPVGVIAWYTTTVPPSGWLECNGQAIGRSQYPDLFREIGVTYGAGDGLNTFNIPDLRGLFVRAWDNGRGVDPGRTFYSYQPQQVGPHTHGAITAVSGYTDTQGSHTHTASEPHDAYGFTFNYSDLLTADGSFTYNGFDGGNWQKAKRLGGAAPWTMTIGAAGAHAHNIAVSATTTIYSNGTSENRVQNVCLLPCIKAIGPASLPRIGWTSQRLDDVTQFAAGISNIARADQTLANLGQNAHGTVT